MKKSLKRHCSPDAITTNGLRSYGAGMKDLGNAKMQEVGHWGNNRVKNGYLPFRRRERAMPRFRQMKTLEKFASVHANVHNHFNLERHLIDRQTYRERRSAALAEWRSGGYSPAWLLSSETDIHRQDTVNIDPARDRSVCA